MAKSKKTLQREKLDELRHPKLLAFRGMKIGPIFPIREELTGMLIGSRGVPRKKTKFPFNDKFRLKRKIRQRLARASKRKNR